MKISLILSGIIAIFTFFIFSLGTSFFERIVYSLILFGSTFGLLELFRWTWDVVRDSFKK